MSAKTQKTTLKSIQIEMNGLKEELKIVKNELTDVKDELAEVKNEIKEDNKELKRSKNQEKLKEETKVNIAIIIANANHVKRLLTTEKTYWSI